MDFSSAEKYLPTWCCWLADRLDGLLFEVFNISVSNHGCVHRAAESGVDPEREALRGHSLGGRRTGMLGHSHTGPIHEE